MMKTLADLQYAVGDDQSEKAFVESLAQLIDSGVLAPLRSGEMVRTDGVVFVSDRTFKIIADSYDITLDADFNPVNGHHQ